MPKTNNCLKHNIEIAKAHSSGPLFQSFVEGEKPCPAFLGVSIKNRMSNRSVLRKTIPWLKSHSLSALVVIGDYPHRHNLMALRGFSPRLALEKAIMDGKRAFRAASDIVAELKAEKHVTVCSAIDLLETIECRDIQDKLYQYFDTNSLFVSDILHETQNYVKRINPDLSHSHVITIIPTLKKYLIEELAMFIHLYHMGYQVEVYPGSDLKIMNNIATSTYHDFPYKCPLRTHVSITLG